MISLDEYIALQKAKMAREAGTPKRRNWLRHFREVCEERGFNVISFNWEQQKSHSIIVTMHNLPSDFDRYGCLHRHDYFELVYVYRGCYVNRTQEQILHLTQGDLMLLNPNVLHSPYCEYDTDVVFNIIIKKEFISNTVVPIMGDSPLFLNFFIDPLYRGDTTQKYLYFHRNSAQICLFAQQIITEYINLQRFTDVMMECALTSLFAQLAREYDNTLGQRSGDSMIYEILSFISQNCLTVTLEALSEKFSYSKSHLSRLIKKQTGQSFSEIVHDQKMKRVLLYLETTSLSVTEIAQFCGFSDMKHFNQSFKTSFGKTPSQYRKDFQGDFS